MRTSTSSYIVELPLRVNDQQNRFLEKAFEFGRTLYNATLGTALGRLQRMRETQEWRVARDMPKGKARTKAFSAVHKAFGLTEFGLTIIANNHRKASGRKDIGAHEAQSIGKAVWRALQRHMFQKAGRPRFKSFRRGLNSIEGTNNREIMYKPERGAIVWRKHVMTYMKPDTGYMKEALASDRHVKYCRIVRRTLNGVKRWFVQLVVEGLPPVRKVYAPKCEVVGIDPGPSRIAYFHEQSCGDCRGCSSRRSSGAEDPSSAAKDRPFKTSEQSRQLQSRRNREKGFVDLEHKQSRTQDGGKACRAPSVPGGHPQARPR